MNIQSYDIIKVFGGRAKRPSLWERIQRWLLAFGCLAVLCTQPAKAVDTDKVAHASVSAMGTVAFYGLYKAILNKDCRYQLVRPENCPLMSSERLGAAGFAAMTMFAIGLVKEIGDNRPDGGDILANGIGAVGAMIPIIAFEF